MPKPDEVSRDAPCLVAHARSLASRMILPSRDRDPHLLPHPDDIGKLLVINPAIPINVDVPDDGIDVEAAAALVGKGLAQLALTDEARLVGVKVLECLQGA